MARETTDLGDGKKLIDWDWDASSGSTMVFTGRYTEGVTVQDIINTFGDGSFGHRGPEMRDGWFKYTKITD